MPWRKKEAKRGAPNGGSIRKREVERDGHTYVWWESRVTTGYDLDTGKQIQRSFSGKSQREVRQKMQAALVDLNNHQYQEPSKMTVGMAGNLGAGILGWNQAPHELSYTQHIRNHILPALGNRKLQDLSGPEIQKFYNQLLREGGKIGCHDKDGNVMKKTGSRFTYRFPCQPRRSRTSTAYCIRRWKRL
ncbi:MAG: N-terminal phage integrase SAM-like domain-containing protein [Dysosmobacter sp.]